MRMRTGQTYVKNEGRKQLGLLHELEQAELAVKELAMQASCRGELRTTDEMRLAVEYVALLKKKIADIMP